MSEFGEPWNNNSSRPTNTPEAVRFLYDSDEDLVGEIDHNVFKSAEMASRVVACVNFLAGIPTPVLHSNADGIKMFLAYLKGDDLSALTWADEVQAMSNTPEGEVFVTRDEIVREVAKLIAEFDKAVPFIFLEHIDAHRQLQRVRRLIAPKS